MKAHGGHKRCESAVVRESAVRGHVVQERCESALEKRCDSATAKWPHESAVRAQK